MGIVSRVPPRLLISVKRGKPDWTLLDGPGTEALPAVRRRLDNLAKLDERKRRDLLARLQDVLALRS